MATGNDDVEIELSRSPTTIITGENSSGKSIVIDALVFALYGVSFRGLNKPQLVNCHNKGKLITDLKFSVRGVDWQVVRGVKPKIFEIYKKPSDSEEFILVPQSSTDAKYQEFLENTVLQMSLESFKQVVIISKTNHQPFMKLPAGKRKEVISQLLGLSTYDDMLILAKMQVKSSTNIISGENAKLLDLQRRADIISEYLMKYHAGNTAKIDICKGNLVKMGETNDKLLLKISDIKSRIYEYDAAGDEDAIRAKIKKAEEFSYKLNVKRTAKNKETDLLTDNAACPLCLQELNQDESKAKIIKNNELVTKLDGAMTDCKHEINRSSVELRDLKSRQSELTTLQNELFRYASNLDTLLADIKRVNSELDALHKPTDAIYTDSELAELMSSIKVHQEIIDDLDTELLYHKKSVDMLKDGPRSMKNLVIKKYLPKFNGLINKYLAVLGFTITINLNDSFIETIIDESFKDFTYASFSEGRKARIDIAILFAWVAIASEKRTLDCNLMFLDEILDGSLDVDGVLSVTELLSSFQNRNIFVITHSPERYTDKFRSELKFKIVNRFSKRID